MLKTKFISLIILLFLILTNCGDGSNPFIVEDDFSLVPDAFSTENAQKIDRESGLTYYEVEVGTGQYEVTIRDRILIHYTGRKTNGDVFDSSYKNGNVEPFNTNITGFIEGFSEGILGMKEGGKRVLIVPPSLGYEGTTNVLRNDTLIFDVEIIEIIL